MGSDLSPTERGPWVGLPGQPRLVTKRGGVICLGGSWGAHTHSCRGRDGVGLRCACGADQAEGTHQQATPALGETHGGGSSCPYSSHLACGVRQQETVSETGEGRGGSAQHGEARALPSKLVLELCAVHMPICFVIAWLFLEATGVSRKPESVDCVSSVWGV